MSSFLRKFETLKPFTDDEAWTLFKLAAFGEAVGWTLLITGLGLKRFVLHGNNVPVLISGQIHGTLFILYIAAALVLYPSLGWSRWRATLAGLASVPPYGSLLLEQYYAHQRRCSRFHLQRHLVIYRQLASARTI